MPPSEQGEKRKQQELSPENGEDLPKTKTSRTECSEEGCTNLAANGGICRRHGVCIFIDLSFSALLVDGLLTSNLLYTGEAH